MASKRKTKRRAALRSKRARRGAKPKAPAKRRRGTPKRKTRKAPSKPRRGSPGRAARKTSSKRPHATEASPTTQVPVFDLGATQQVAAAEVLGDIEEAMALDRIREDG